MAEGPDCSSDSFPTSPYISSDDEDLEYASFHSLGIDPYQYEPDASDTEQDSNQASHSASNSADDSRLNNTDW